MIDFRVDYGRHFNKETFLVMVNLSAAHLARNRDVRGRDITVVADPSDFLVQLAQNNQRPSAR